MRVKSRLVWNLGSAWLCPSAMARMSSSSRGRCSSAGLRRRRQKASTQVMPLRSSCRALRIVPRFHPRWASAQTCPPRPIAWTVLAMKARRWLPLRALAVSMRTGIISGEGRISVTPEAPGAKPTGYRTLSFFQAPYQGGVLRDARTGREVRRWEVQDELIVPPAYTVALEARDGGRMFLVEDEEAVWLEEGAKRTALTRRDVSLPNFAGHRYAAVLRVLHQELLVNVIDGRPVPNFLVYDKPWYRDGAMMAMVFKETGNLGLIRDWVLGLREPFDRNNGGETEADNLGQALYLISLVSDKDHPLVPVVLRESKRFEKGRHIEGRSDFAPHPVFQTKWAKFGLRALGLADPYEVPQVADSYATLFWWAYKADDRPGQQA